MSYILNALKNSENQRNLGEIPRIDSQPEFVRAVSGKFGERAWKGAALLAVSVLLLSLAWSRFGGEQGAVSEPVETKAPAPVEHKVPVPVPVPTPAPVLAPAPAPIPAPVPAAAPTPTPALTSAPAPVPAPPAPAVAPPEQAPGLPALQDMAGVRIRVEESAAATRPKVVLEMPVSAGVVPRDRAPQMPLSGPGPGAASEAPPAEVLNGVSHWKTLPADVQKQLREMAFTAHIYSTTPSSRFIRVSGRTLHEGDQLNSEMQLQQITRDGIVFSYRAGKFWIGAN